MIRTAFHYTVYENFLLPMSLSCVIYLCYQQVEICKYTFRRQVKKKYLFHDIDKKEFQDLVSCGKQGHIQLCLLMETNEGHASNWHSAFFFVRLQLKVVVVMALRSLHWYH